MKILLVNHYAGSPVHGMEYRPFFLAREWTRLGHEVVIVAASFSHLRSGAPHIRGAVTHEDIEGVHYAWLRTPSYEGNGLRRVKNIFSFLWQLSWNKKAVLGGLAPDIVIASSTYPLDIYPAYEIAKVAGARLVYEVHDLWPLSLIELGGMSKRHPFIMLVQVAENRAYRVSDKVVSLLPKADGHMRAHGMAAYKFAYVPNGVDFTEWGKSAPLPVDHAAVLARLKETGRFIVGYAGAHGIANGLGAFIDAARLLRNSAATLVLVGQGPEKDSLKRRVRELGLTNVEFLPPVSRAAIPVLLQTMDALYLGVKHSTLFRFGVSPNKLMDYMMAARPVIQAINAGNDMVAESGCGISVSAEGADEIAGAIVDLMDKRPSEREEMGLRGQEYVMKNHDYRVLAKRFIEEVVR